ncbi:putative N-acetyltransferase YjcF [Falsiruegeria litorea R37]|uniref:Putative N-acetyltransferase YjcF n=1 Tax=Falsiruegeria litorea R37 TaxID=1200284 RepID=A0A1Y5TH93_9RHOB|nr:GNAT family N-acetyltransferase [Falsiruegeria litorea]SLN62026.1 putative N-acetyltransferase YjcF [Falsiruegeria litorea R37]
MMLTIEVTQDRDACFVLRHRVFVEEQGVPIEEEIDVMDEVATHMLATLDSAPSGTARVLFDGETAKIGRVCVLPQGRGTGMGVALIRKGIEIAQEQSGITRVKLGAQVQALGFYEKLGFEVCGPVYDDAGIDHRDMVLNLA